MKSENNNKPDWNFYLAWIILAAFCVPIAFLINAIIFLRFLTIIFGDFIFVDGVRRITEDYLGIFTFIPLIGLLSGLVQFGLLRRYLPRMGWWVLATFGGWLLGVLLILMSGWFNSWTYESFDLDLAFIEMGLSIGVGQWLLFRRRLSRAGWWIGANVLGWVLLGLITGEGFGQGGIFAVGIMPACVTAAMLAWLMNQAQPTKPQGV
jgi:hypothetical protein